MKKWLFISTSLLFILPTAFSQGLMDKDTLYITTAEMSSHNISEFDLETSVVIQMKVEGSGNVASAKSTINMVNEYLLDKALAEAKKRKYPPKENSNDLYMATVTYIFLKKQ